MIKVKTLKLNKKHRMFCALAALSAAYAIWAGAAQADTPTGVWLTKPDAKGQVAHVQARRCGSAYCGTITRTFDAQGREIRTPNIGKQVFWDMRPEGDGYAGRAFVPAHGKTYAGRLKVRGNTMQVQGCIGPVCQGQTWTRVN